VKVCLEALLFCPDNAEVLTTIGLLYLRMGESLKAFDFLGNSLSNDPRNVKSILAAASVIQASCALHSVLKVLHVHLVCSI
jgi:Bardet-Biedl syndrome 4 protein